ncbi:hypothetical protein NQ314_006023 [Rhamnusium bicolor]|uniref:E3 ubiquitin-protein ligase n=1 Tax=Rhamnusium bicolor TaxID=1586634 RepID=A0AAV8ZAA9_9CUCU|nr:hypothetical protein NQ314_006023 [Rhamnusium bicolor]
MRYPCINFQSGCNSRLFYNEREAHELGCSYKCLKCPIEKCAWVGRLGDIARHWASKKITSKPYHASNICHTKMKSESYYVNMVEAYEKLFWFKYKLSNRKLYWAMQLIGNSSEAENYFYEIEVFKPGRTKRKILLSDYCQSIDIENPCLFKEGVCISINSDMVDQFLREDRLLTYYMRVYATKVEKTEEEAVSRENPNERKQRDRSMGPHQFRNKDTSRKYSQGRKHCFVIKKKKICIFLVEN